MGIAETNSNRYVPTILLHHLFNSSFYINGEQKLIDNTIEDQKPSK